MYARVTIHVSRRLEDGQALVEYALVLAFVAVVCAVTLGLLGSAASQFIEDVAGAF